MSRKVAMQRSQVLSLSVAASLMLLLSSVGRPIQAASSNARPNGQLLAQASPQVASNPLFQSPAALAAAAAVAAAASAANNGPAPMSVQAQPGPAPSPSMLISNNQHQHPAGLAARIEGPPSMDSLAGKAQPQILGSSSLATSGQGQANPSVASAASALPAAPVASSSGPTPNQLQQAIQAKYAPINMETECLASGGSISFELITGYVLGAPAELMLMQPGTIQLTECLNICRSNSSCLAINFETGLCVLLQDSADRNPQALQKSQYPVFTIYAHKICLQSSSQADRMAGNKCNKSWSFERVIGWVLNNMEKKTLLTKTRLECLQACYNEPAFQCKSFNYDLASGSCQLSDVDRHSLPNGAHRRRNFVESPVDTLDYGENNCVQEVRGICDFKPLANKILKTVDSIYQDIKSEPECRKRCLQAPYRCHSYDLGDSSNPVCRTSHLDRNSLQQIQEPHLEMQGAVSYELDSCYNVTVSCKSREMVARVKTNKLFNGKIYAKNSPLSCMSDITNSMDFELQMAFNDACSISKNSQSGLFTNEIVIQHNDMVVTNADIGLNLKCQYDLRNQTVYNNINLDDFISRRDPIDIVSQSALVRSPNISMQILKHDGNHIQQAQVGDPLMLRFQITDERSPFEIFVRDLYAMDGVGGSEIMLIDGEGCPTDPSIMAAMSNAKSNGQTLEAQFDAFKFPTSETVAFRALVTPCIPHCEPVHCQTRASDGVLYEAESFGKRRRRRRRRSVSASQPALASSAPKALPLGAPEEVVVRNSIAIKDRFFQESADGGQNQMGSNGAGSNKLTYELDYNSMDSSQATAANQWLFGSSLSAGTMTLLFLALLCAQSALIIGWAVMWPRRTSKLATSGSSASLASVNQQPQVQRSGLFKF